MTHLYELIHLVVGNNNGNITSFFRSRMILQKRDKAFRLLYDRTGRVDKYQIAYSRKPSTAFPATLNHNFITHGLVDDKI